MAMKTQTHRPRKIRDPPQPSISRCHARLSPSPTIDVRQKQQRRKMTIHWPTIFIGTMGELRFEGS
jgi:hypothetical protein